MHANLTPLRPVLVCTGEAIDNAVWEHRGLAVHLPDAIRDGERLVPLAAIYIEECAASVAEVVRRAHQRTGAPLILGVGDCAGAEAGATVSLLEATGATMLVETQHDQALAAASVAAIVRRLAPAGAAAGADVIEVGPNVVLDLATRCIIRGCDVHPLSPTEFRLLSALLRAGGRASSHDELVARVWGSERVSGHHYLRLYIRYLRHKLEDDPKRPRLLQNVWGIGYRLVPAQRTRESVDLPALAGEGAWGADSSLLHPPR